MKIKTNIRAGAGGGGTKTQTQTQTHSGGATVYVPPIILARCVGI